MSSYRQTLLEPRARGSFLGLALAGTLACAACLPIAPPETPQPAKRQKRALVPGPFLEFHGHASQLGDLREVASKFRIIAVDANPLDGRFTPGQLRTLKADGRNVLLGIVDVGYCDRTKSSWWTAPEGLVACVQNFAGQIAERSARPQQVWMDVSNVDHQDLVIEHQAQQTERAGVDGFLVDGLELLDHGPDDSEAPCDEDCVAGGLTLLASLQNHFPRMLVVIQGGLTPKVIYGRAKRSDGDEGGGDVPVNYLVDGVVGEQVYTPSYNAGKEAALRAWKAVGARRPRKPIAIFTQDYVKDCSDAEWARMINRASRAQGFIPSIGLPPVNRGHACAWSDL
jgi:cysteinyl-tRNA synthetase